MCAIASWPTHTQRLIIHYFPMRIRGSRNIVLIMRSNVGNLCNILHMDDIGHLRISQASRAQQAYAIAWLVNKNKIARQSKVSYEWTPNVILAINKWMNEWINDQRWTSLTRRFILSITWISYCIYLFSVKSCNSSMPYLWRRLNETTIENLHGWAITNRYLGPKPL